MTKSRENVSSAILVSGGILVFLSLQLTQDLPVLERKNAVLFTIAGILIIIIGFIAAKSENNYNVIEKLFSGGYRCFNVVDRMRQITRHFIGYTYFVNIPEVL